MSHFVKKCSCGKVLASCRCMKKDKRVDIIPDACPTCRERRVIVCSECQRASCWQGAFYCEKSKAAGTKLVAVSTLRDLALESPSYWVPEKAQQALEEANPVKPLHPACVGCNAVATDVPIRAIDGVMIALVAVLDPEASIESVVRDLCFTHRAELERLKSTLKAMGL